MIRKSPYKRGSVEHGVVKKTPSISVLMGKHGPPATPRLPGTYSGETLPRPNSKRFWKDRTP